MKRDAGSVTPAGIASASAHVHIHSRRRTPPARPRLNPKGARSAHPGRTRPKRPVLYRAGSRPAAPGARPGQVHPADRGRVRNHERGSEKDLRGDRRGKPGNVRQAGVGFLACHPGGELSYGMRCFASLPLSCLRSKSLNYQANNTSIILLVKNYHNREDYCMSLRGTKQSPLWVGDCFVGKNTLLAKTALWLRLEAAL